MPGEVIHTTKKNKSGIPKDKTKALTDKYVSVLKLASDEYEKHPPTKDFMDGFKGYKECLYNINKQFSVAFIFTVFG